MKIEKKNKMPLLDDERLLVVGNKDLLSDEDPDDWEDPETEEEEPSQPVPEFNDYDEE